MRSEPWPGPATKNMPDHLWPALTRHAQARPSVTALRTRDAALRTRDAALTWADLDHAAAITQRFLRQRLGELDVSCRAIVHDCDNRLADVLIYLACLRGDMADVPIDASLPDVLRSPLEDRVGGLRLTADDLSEIELSWQSGQGASIAPRIVAPSSTALVLWTSGTTETPKGVRLSHRALATNAAAKLAAVPQSPSDVRLTVLPICHAYARTCDLGTWLLSGCELAITRGLRGWKEWAPVVRPTLSNVVPALVDRLLQDDIPEESFLRLRLLGCGGAGLSEASFEAWQQRGVTVIQGYGLTETAPVICSATPDDAAPGCVGRPVEGWETKLVDGRLHVRGPSVMSGYLDQPDLGLRDWFDTGDHVEIDAKTGQFRILGRNDDVLTLSTGYQVHPSIVERTLMRSPHVSEAVVGLADGVLVAWIAANANDDESLAFASAHNDCTRRLQDIPPGQQPKEIRPIRLSADDLNRFRTRKGTLRRRDVLRRIGDDGCGHT